MMQSLLTPAPVKNQGGEVQTPKDPKQPANLDKAPSSEQADFEKLMQDTIDSNQVTKHGALLAENDGSELFSEQVVSQSVEVVSTLPLDREGGVIGQDIMAEQPSQLADVDNQNLALQTISQPLDTSESQDTLQQLDSSETPEQLAQNTAQPIQSLPEVINQDSDLQQLSVVNTVQPEVLATGAESSAQASNSEEPTGDTLVKISQTSEQAQLINKIQESQQATTAVVSSDELKQRQQASETWQSEIRDTNKKVSQETLLASTLKGDESEKNISLESSMNQPKTAKVGIGEAVLTTEAVAKGEIKGAIVDGTEQVNQTSNTIKHESLASSQAPVDVNGAKPIQTNAMQSDRSIAINQQLQATNSLLQEPLDIKSKQAASMVGERVMMMISQGKQEVNIRLDPAELGSMTVKVQVQQDQVNLNIQTQASVSKDILEQNLPRLREQLAQQGIQLGDANVQQQSQQQGQQSQDGELGVASRSKNQSVESVEQEDDAIWIPSPVGSVEQGIDFYA